MGVVAYKLDMLVDSCVHPVFHVSLLHVAYGVTNLPPILPLHVFAILELVVEPSEVLNVRNTHSGQSKEVLIQWKSWAISKNFFVDFKKSVSFRLAS